MADIRPNTITRLLRRMDGGDAAASGELFAIVYAELKRIARVRMRSQAISHTLQPTALVNEAWLRLSRSSLASITDRRHFFHFAARAMRQVLLDHARSKHRLKRGAGWERRVIDDVLDEYERRAINLIELDAALRTLESVDPQAHEIVQQHFFNGLPLSEVAVVVSIPLRTVERRWQAARMFLFRELRK